MKRPVKTFATVLFVLWATVILALPTKVDSVRFEVLMSSKMLSDVKLNDKFIQAVDITSSLHILLSTTDQFFLLGWGGVLPLGKKVDGKISSYAFSPDSLLMTIRNNELCTFDSLGNLTRLFKLPGEGMGISAGKYVMYIFDHNYVKTKYALYVLAQGGKYAKLFDVPTPINSVVEMNDLILFSTENGLFSFNLKNNELKALAALPKDKKIISIALNTSNNMIYFSTENAVYALKDSNAVVITNKFGGVLKYYVDGLIVFNPEKKFLIRIVGLDDKIVSNVAEKKTTPNNKPSKDILTNTSIVNLVKAKLSDDLIINLINSSEVNFNVSVDSIIFLSTQNVSSGVIKEMKNAMDKKSSNMNNGSNSDNNVVPNNVTPPNNNPLNTGNTIVKNYFIIAGNYPNLPKANDAIAYLKSQGYPDAEIADKNSFGFYKVAYKAYTTCEEAEKDLTKIKLSINPSAWIFDKNKQ